MSSISSSSSARPLLRPRSSRLLRFVGPAAALLAAAGAGGGLLLAAAPARAIPTKPWALRLGTAPFEARFALETDDGKAKDDSSGRLFLQQSGALCIAVERPLRQHLLFDSHALVIYYPDDKIVLRAKPRLGQLPPMVDALYTGFMDPASIVPPTSTILEQRRDEAAATLTTRWSLRDKDGKQHGQLRAVETREGTSQLELLNDDGKLMRRYDFADRVKLGKASIPRSVTVLYVKPNVHDRIDRWKLEEVVPEKDADPGPVDCTSYPKTLPIKDIAL